nr:MAG TPA: hypothetical protein [Caudoviricetes sp.]
MFHCSIIFYLNNSKERAKTHKQLNNNQITKSYSFRTVQYFDNAV